MYRNADIQLNAISVLVQTHAVPCDYVAEFDSSLYRMYSNVPIYMYPRFAKIRILRQ